MVNILLVDDNSGNLILNKHLLRSLKHEVTTYNCPMTAFKALEQSNPFDVIMVDVRMPYMNGGEFFHAVKRLYPEAVFIFTSASSYAEIKEVIPAKEAAYSLFGGYFTAKRFMAVLDTALQTSSV